MYSHAAQGVKHYGGLSKLGYINIEQIEKYRRKDELVAMAAAGGRIVQGQHLELRPAVKRFTSSSRNLDSLQDGDLIARFIKCNVKIEITSNTKQRFRGICALMTTSQRMTSTIQ